jgi:hypothetical protein
MMTVGDVQRGNSPGCLDEGVAIAAVHAPQRMTHRIGCLEVDQRLGLDGLRDDPIDLGARAVDQEYRAGLRADGQHVPGPIVFLVGTRPFVLLDDAALVLIERVAGGDAGLFVPAHTEPVQIQTRRIFDHERRLLQRREVLRGARVHGIGVGIRAGRQFELRP